MNTPITAAAGTASNAPTMPSRAAPASTAKISQTGWTPIRLPTRRGVTKLPSMNWPAANTAATTATMSQSWNWNMATTRPTHRPSAMPM